MKYKDIENFIRFIVAIGGIYNIDEEGYIISKKDNERITIPSSDGKKRNLIIFQEEINDNDAIIINPFNETMSEDINKKWMYAMLSSGLAKRVIELVRYINDSCLSKNIDDINLVEFINEFIKDIDDKFYGEFRTLTKSYSEFINVFYKRNFKEARFRCLIFDDIDRNAYKIRKKTWTILDKIFNKIFDISNDSKRYKEANAKYSFKSSNITCPRLHATLRVYNEIYTQLNPYLEFIAGMDDDILINLDEFAYHLNNLDEYYKKMKWFIQAFQNTEQEKEISSPIMQSDNNQNMAIPQYGSPRQFTPSGIPLVVKENPIQGNASRFSGFNPQPPFMQQQQPMQFANMNSGFNNPYGNGGSLINTNTSMINTPLQNIYGSHGNCNSVF